MKRIYLLLAMLAIGSISYGANAEMNDREIRIVIQEVDYVSFTLRNKSLKSIPLMIPGVMNPNLSPASKSGVTLKVGQEIIFKYRGQKHVLLVVTEALEGQELEVASLLKKARQRIDQEK